MGLELSLMISSDSSNFIKTKKYYLIILIISRYLVILRNSNHLFWIWNTEREIVIIFDINSWSVDQEIRIFLFHAIDSIIRSWPAVVGHFAKRPPHNFKISPKTWMKVWHVPFLYLQLCFSLFHLTHIASYLWHFIN